MEWNLWEEERADRKEAWFLGNVGFVFALVCWLTCAFVLFIPMALVSWCNKSES